MTTVKIGDVKFKLLFDADERPYTADEMADLEESIEKNGIIDPIVTWKEERKTGEKESVVVGATRCKVAAKIGLEKVPLRILSFKSKEEAREYNKQTACRRHLTPEEQLARRAARIPRIVEAREKGDSLRIIAENEKVSEATVRRDLETVSTAQGGAVEPPDGKVTGQDGRTRTATPAKPDPIYCKTCARAKRVGQELPKNCPDCKKARDAAKLSKDVQKTLAEEPDEPDEPATIEQIISRENSALEKWAKTLLAMIDTIPDAPWLKDLDRKASAIKSLKNVAETIRSAKCIGPCPMCHSEGCPKCYKSGRVTRYAKQQMV